PPENGLLGSTASTATRRSRERYRPTSAETNVLLPAPGGPVTPMIQARPVAEPSAPSSASASIPPRSTTLSARATALGSPARTASASTGPVVTPAPESSAENTTTAGPGRGPGRYSKHGSSTSPRHPHARLPCRREHSGPCRHHGVLGCFSDARRTIGARLCRRDQPRRLRIRIRVRQYR